MLILCVRIVSSNHRYGLAESIVGRRTMEDRTTAIASIEGSIDISNFRFVVIANI